MKDGGNSFHLEHKQELMSDASDWRMPASDTWSTLGKARQRMHMLFGCLAHGESLLFGCFDHLASLLGASRTSASLMANLVELENLLQLL